MNDHDRLSAVRTATAMSQVTSTQRVILAAFAAMSDDDGCVTVQVSEMARTLRFPRRTIQRSLPYMISKGYLEVMPESRQFNEQRNSPYVFRLGAWAFEQRKAAA